MGAAVRTMGKWVDRYEVHGGYRKTPIRELACRGTLPQNGAMRYVFQLMWLQLRESVRSRGIGGTVLFFARHSAELPTRVRRFVLEATYDRRMGVRTSGLVNAVDLGIDPSKIGGVARGAI